MCVNTKMISNEYTFSDKKYYKESLRFEKKTFYLSSGTSTKNNQTHQDKGVHTEKIGDSATVRKSTIWDIKAWRLRCILI